MVEKDPTLSALEIGELDMFVESIVAWRVECVGNQA